MEQVSCKGTYSRAAVLGPNHSIRNTKIHGFFFNYPFYSVS